jgi:hypothetical protein
MDAQNGSKFDQSDEYRDDRSTYSQNFGSYVADYTDFALGQTNQGSLSTVYNKPQDYDPNNLNLSPTVSHNNDEFMKIDKTQGDNSIATKIIGKVVEKLEIGAVNTYKNAKKATGDGTIHRDHIPSKEALKQRAEEMKGRPLSKEETKRIEEESFTINVKDTVHREASTTGGGNRILSKEDAKDLEKAVQRDTTERIESTKRLDPQNLDKIQKGCDGIGCTNKEYDNFLKNILSGK